MAQQQQLPQLPNFANMQTAADGMTQTMNSYNTHHQNFNTEVLRFSNYGNAQVLHQLGVIQQQLNIINWQTTLTRAQFDNLVARMHHGKLAAATDGLIPMYSVEQGPNPQVPAGLPVPNFPRTPDDVSNMTVPECQSLLLSLNCPIPTGNNDNEHQTAVRKAIGLQAV